MFVLLGPVTVMFAVSAPPLATIAVKSKSDHTVFAVTVGQ
jgi:hypothetical protein